MVFLLLSAITVVFSLYISGSGLQYDRSKVDITEDHSDSTEGFISTENGRIWFKIAGTDKRKTPLMLIHGGPGASHDYFGPLEKLSDDRPVIFYDQSGCGNSDKPGDTSVYSVENYVREVAEVRRALGLDEVHILGQSWGGGLAAAYYIYEKPPGVKSLVLSSPLLDSGRWMADQRRYLAELPKVHRENVRIAEEMEIYDSKEYEEAMEEYYSRHLCRLDPWPPLVLITFEKMSVPVYSHMWGPSEFTCTGTLKSFSLTKRLSGIDVPVLIICGEYDEAAPWSMKFFCGCINDCDLLVLKDASHMNHLEREEEYIESLAGYLDSHD